MREDSDGVVTCCACQKTPLQEDHWPKQRWMTQGPSKANLAGPNEAEPGKIRNQLEAN